MQKSLIAALLATTCASGFFISAAQAGTIPTVITYPSVGTINSKTYTFTATSIGQVDAYFVGSSASDTDEMYTSFGGGAFTASSPVTDNTGVTDGEMFDLGNATSVGEILTFELINSNTGTHLFSSPGSNPDGDQHVWSSVCSGSSSSVGGCGDSGRSAGVFLAWGGLTRAQSRARDYNGLEVVLTNVALTTTPLPATFPLFATGLGLTGLFGWRRKRKIGASIAAA